MIDRIFIRKGLIIYIVYQSPILSCLTLFSLYNFLYNNVFRPFALNWFLKRLIKGTINL